MQRVSSNCLIEEIGCTSYNLYHRTPLSPCSTSVLSLYYPNHLVAVGRQVFIYTFNFSRVMITAVPTAFVSSAAHEFQSTETVTAHHDLKEA